MDKAELLKQNRDELTGLLDKQAFYVWAQELIDTADEDTNYAFIFFDMDNFKLFNANYGFEKGDALLIGIADIIKDVFENQLVAKFSGDHFAVCTNTTQIIPAITEIKTRVKLIQKNINLELKAGVYVLDGETKDVVRCSDRARMACVSIKKKYDVDYKFYDEELAGSLIRKQFIIDNLDEALTEGYIQVYYQPIVRGLSGDVCGWEALVRWIDPERGIVYPSEFISVLEEYRLIHKLDSYVMEQVIKNISEIEKAGGEEAVPVSINLSRIDFEALDIVPFIDKLIEKYDANPRLFNFEITESVLMENPRFIQEQIVRLRTKGYRVWMDDFGSGYSSLNVLKNFEFDLVKIDMEFLRGFESSDDGKIIIKHMVSMLKNLGFHTLAEGVETKEQMDFLKSVGCELIQGYLIGRPMPFEDAAASISRNGMRYEKLITRDFFNSIGVIDILKQNPLESIDNQLSTNILPLAMGVVKDNEWRFIYANDGYKEGIKIYGHESIAVAEDMINNIDWPWVQRNAFWDILTSSKESNRAESIEFVESGKIVNMKVRHIVYDEKTDSDAYLASIRTLSNHMKVGYNHRVSIISKYLLSLYECIDVFGIDNEYYENIYLSNSRVHVMDENSSQWDVIKGLAEERVHEGDRQQFYDFMNTKTVRERLDTEKNRIKVSFFRILNSQNQYVWKEVTIRIIKYLGHEVMLTCVAEATREFSENMDAFLEGGYKVMFGKIFKSDVTKNEYAFENILRLVPMGVFWKDRERRFVGANQMFLDYYGLKSLDAILGKTDEDMGWHIDPEPFKQDELDVIHKGKSIQNVPGECIVKGDIRRIVASKQPFIVNGETIGLIGFFKDVTEQLKEKEKLEYLSNTDELTTLFNRRAFDDIIQKYINQYTRDNTDFVMVLIDIDKFKQINDMYGHDFGDEVLKRVAQIIRNVTSNSSVAFRIGGDEFAILHQHKSQDEIIGIEHELQLQFSKVERISGMDIKLKASIGAAVYSNSGDVHDLINRADKHMYDEKEKHKGHKS